VDQNGNGSRDPDLQRKLLEGRRAFLRREAAAVAVQLSGFVSHADDLGVPIARADFETLQRAYQILDGYGKGT